MQECTDDKSLPVSLRKQLQIKNVAQHSHKVNLKFVIKKKNEKEQVLYIYHYIYLFGLYCMFYNSFKIKEKFFPYLGTIECLDNSPCIQKQVPKIAGSETSYLELCGFFLLFNVFRISFLYRMKYFIRLNFIISRNFSRIKHFRKDFVIVIIEKLLSPFSK